MDALHAVTNWIDHNRGAFIGTVLALAVLLMGFAAPQGCEPETRSLVDPSVMVSETEFLVEARIIKDGLLTEMASLSVALDAVERQVLLLETRTDLGLVDIEIQRETFVEVLTALESISLQAASGTLNPLALIPMAFGIGGLLFGVGKQYDNARKDKVIADLKNGAATSSA